jgi:CheY-like chemotaxis protein
MAKAVLIVDDTAVIRQVPCELFTRESDFKVCGQAVNGREAIEKAQQLHPDLIVLDLSMPVMNGLEAARVLKRLMPTLPIITFRGDAPRRHWLELKRQRCSQKAGTQYQGALPARVQHRMYLYCRWAKQARQIEAPAIKTWHETAGYCPSVMFMQ